MGQLGLRTDDSGSRTAETAFVVWIWGLGVLVVISRSGLGYSEDAYHNNISVFDGDGSSDSVRRDTDSEGPIEHPDFPYPRTICT